MFEQKPGQKPVGKVVKAHDFVDVPAGALIVPGAKAVPGQKASGDIFPGKNAEGVDGPSQENGNFPEHFKDRFKDTYASVDGKHPQRGAAGKPHVPPAQGAQGGEKDFKAPSKEPALKEGFKKFFHHGSSIGGKAYFYTWGTTKSVVVHYDLFGRWEQLMEQGIKEWDEEAALSKYKVQKGEMTYRETMAYVEELGKYGVRPGLTNMENLMEKLGNPQKGLAFVHIAGTNGKGSVAAFISEILQQAGYRTGRYISPAIFDYREEIQVGKRPISKKELCRKMTVMREICRELAGEGKPHPTAFEVKTAMAFWHFREQKCQIVVLEAGLGGLLDATNIITDTKVAVFTSISLDHMRVLGGTLKEIAGQKAGIMKPGAAAVALKGEEEAVEVLKERAKALCIPLILVDVKDAYKIKRGLEKQSFSYGEYRDLTITLAGSYQIENAMVAVRAVEELKKAGFPVKDKAIYRGLLQTFWPGRFQVLSGKPCFIADGAHNRDAARRLAESLGFYFTNRRILYIIGMLRDKEQEEVLRITCPLAEQILTVPTRGERGCSSYELAQKAGKYHKNVTATDSVEEAVELSYLLAGKEAVIVAFGSLSYLGELIRIVNNGQYTP